MNTERDEYLEALWRLQEQRRDSVADLRAVLGRPFEQEVIDGLVSDSMVEFDGKKVALTGDGREHARDLVRKHRLGERLLYNVLEFRSDSFETEACTFEHLMAPHVVEGICTLLGHPRECPHGLPIPEGECCKRSEKMVRTSVVHLSELAVGETGRVAYVNCQNDAQLHVLNGLQIKPGAEIKLHQKYPSYVAECEGGMIAVDEQIAHNICLWKKPDVPETAVGQHAGDRMGRRRRRRGRR